MAEALAIVALYPLTMLGTSVCSTNIHRRTTARWSAGRSHIIVGTEVPGQSCCINQEELLGPSHCAHRTYHLLSHFSWQAPHVHLLLNLLLDCVTISSFPCACGCCAPRVVTSLFLLCGCCAPEYIDTFLSLFLVTLTDAMRSLDVFPYFANR